jgi:hypothetical protein
MPVWPGGPGQGESEHRLLVKKPDYLGNSRWEFRLDDRAIEAKVMITLGSMISEQVGSPSTQATHFRHDSARRFTEASRGKSSRRGTTS